MTFENRFRQSSEDWQENVRLENRLRHLERETEDLERKLWWMTVGFCSGMFVILVILMAHR